MITKKIRNSNFKLFKYNLVKLQIYSDKPFFDNINLLNNILEQIEIYSKQVLKIIFEYSVWQFIILFTGFPLVSKIKQMKLIDFINHDFITEKSWIIGIFRNRFSILIFLKLVQSQNFSKNVNLTVFFLFYSLLNKRFLDKIKIETRKANSWLNLFSTP